MKTYNFIINGNSYSVTINSVEGGIADVTVTAQYKIDLTNSGISVSPEAASPAPAPAAETPAAPASPAPAPAPAAPSAASGKSTKVVAPLPGNIVDISVKVGDAVKAGQQVAVLEAMKMENAIESPVGGTVVEILASVGDALAADAPIMTIA